MTISELIENLEELRDEYGDETEVRFASQPRYPFEYEISEVVGVSAEAEREVLRLEMSLEGATPEEIEEELSDVEDTDPIVYLAEGSQIGYLPEAATEALGW